MILEDPAAEHEIRLYFTRNSGYIAVSCICRRGRPPLAERSLLPADEALTVYRAHLHSLPEGNTPMSKPEIYISIDAETDGPAPGLHSMLALGAIALSPDSPEGELAPIWYSTLRPLPGPGTRQHPETMAWWKTQPEAWEEVQRNRQHPDDAISDFAGWVEALPGKPVAVAWPAAFDFAFVNWYLWRFAGRNPLGFSCLDIGSFARGLGRPVTHDDLDLPHSALDDATVQGRLFIQLLRTAREKAF